MTGWLHRRTYRALALTLAAVWIVTLALADTAVTPAMHCQRGHMPCCPRGGEGESCSGTRCTEQVPEKAEAQDTQARESEAVAVAPARMDAPRAARPEPVLELTSGPRYHVSVLRLKDDLRI
ncbi:MAG: hypothetical protein WB524_19845 [Acidobacteriaceae bacterium]